MTREEASKIFTQYIDYDAETPDYYEMEKACKVAIKALEQEPCEDCISRKSLKHKLQEHHDFFVNAYGGFSNLPLNDKSRVDEITNCIAMVVNEPSVQPKPKTDVLDNIRSEIIDTGAYEQEVNGKTEFLKGINYCLGVIDKYKAEKE